MKALSSVLRLLRLQHLCIYPEKLAALLAAASHMRNWQSLQTLSASLKPLQGVLLRFFGATSEVHLPSVAVCPAPSLHELKLSSLRLTVPRPFKAGSSPQQLASTELPTAGLRSPTGALHLNQASSLTARLRSAGQRRLLDSGWRVGSLP